MKDTYSNTMYITIYTLHVHVFLFAKHIQTYIHSNYVLKKSNPIHTNGRPARCGSAHVEAARRQLSLRAWQIGLLGSLRRPVTNWEKRVAWRTGTKKKRPTKIWKTHGFLFFFTESWILSLRCCCVVLLFMVGGLEQTLLRDGFSIVEAKLLETSVSSRIPWNSRAR